MIPAESGPAIAITCRHSMVLVPRKPGSGKIGILNIGKKGKASENPDLWMAGILQWMAGRNQDHAGPIVLVQIHREDCGSDICEVAMGTEKDQPVHAWLTDLLNEMLVRNVADHLPCAVIQAIAKKKKSDHSPEEQWGRVTRRRIEAELNDEYGPYHCYLEAFALADARIPVGSDADLQRIARARFAPFVEGWLHA